MMLDKERGISTEIQGDLTQNISNACFGLSTSGNVIHDRAVELLASLHTQEGHNNIKNGTITLTGFELISSAGKPCTGNTPKCVVSNWVNGDIYKASDIILKECRDVNAEIYKVFINGISIRTFTENVTNADGVTDIEENESKALYLERLSVLQKTYVLDTGYLIGFNDKMLLETCVRIIRQVCNTDVTVCSETDHENIKRQLKEFYYSVVAFVHNEGKFVYTQRNYQGLPEKVFVQRQRLESKLQITSLYHISKNDGKKRRRVKITLHDLLTEDISGMFLFDDICIIPYRIDRPLEGLQEQGLLNVYVPLPYIPFSTIEYQNILLRCLDENEGDINDFNEIYNLKYKSLGFEYLNDDMTFDEVISLLKHGENHFKDIIASGYEDRLIYLINFLMLPFVDPGRQTQTMLIICGQLGSGKSVVFEPILRMMGPDRMLLGEHIGCFFEGNKFNYPLYGKLFVVWEEVSYPRGALSAIKNAITAPTQLYHKKSQTPFSALSPTSYIGLTNNKYILPIDKGSRRFVFLDVQNPHALNTSLQEKYFSKLMKLFNNDFLFWVLMDYMFIKYYEEDYKFTRIPCSTSAESKNQRLNSKLIDGEAWVVEITQNMNNFVSSPVNYNRNENFVDIDEDFYTYNNINEDRQVIYIHAFEKNIHPNINARHHSVDINIHRIDDYYCKPMYINWYRTQIVEKSYQAMLSRRSKYDINRILENVSTFYNAHVDDPIFKYEMNVLKTADFESQSFTVLKWPRFEQSYVIVYKVYGAVYNLPYLNDIYPKVKHKHTSNMVGQTTFTWNQFCYWYEVFVNVYQTNISDFEVFRTLYIDFICQCYPIRVKDDEEKIDAVRSTFSEVTWFEKYYEPNPYQFTYKGESIVLTRELFFQ